jgi:integrator complex subunit 12
MAMSATTELDPVFRNALKLLHSSKTDSAEKLRNALDELIKQKFGSSKMLINVLSKKHLAEEVKSSGSNLKPKPLSGQKKLTTGGLQMATGSPILEGISVTSSQSPTILSDLDQVQEELMELLCCVCRRMDNSAKNCLVECHGECHSLYHQECHKPPISDSDANNTDPEHNWYCSTCRNKDALIEIDSSNESPSKSSTSSETRHKKKKDGTSSKHYDSSSSDSSESLVIKKSSHSGSHKKSSSSRDGYRDGDSRSSSDSRDRSSHSKSSASGAAAASSSASVTPSINIVSADKRLQIMKKKAAKMHETKRKHK